MQNYLKSLVFLCCLLSMTPTARGAGLWLYEIGTPDVGTAIAGRAAMASDASTAFTNPAGMTRLDRSQLMVGVQGLYLNADFDTDRASFGGDDGGNAGGFIPVGSFSYVHSFTPKFKAGVSLGSYFGLGVDYGDDFSGRYYNKEASLTTFGLTPSVAYRINDWLSVGGGLTVLYAELLQKVAINNGAVPGQAGLKDGEAKVEDDDTGVGFSLGVLLEPREDTRIGINYLSEVDLDFNDVASLKNVGPVLQGLLNVSGLTGSKVDLDMTIPQMVMVSGFHQINDQWAVMGNVGWQGWSAFGKQEFHLRSTTSRSFTKDLDYDDTWHFALGAQYRFRPRWLWSFGAAYDTSPIDDDEGRTPDLALDDQLRLATGIQYDWSDAVTVGAAYEYVDLGDGGIDRNDGPLKGELKGDYSPYAMHVVALNLIYKF